jgi:hypothetical protein
MVRPPSSGELRSTGPDSSSRFAPPARLGSRPQLGIDPPMLAELVARPGLVGELGSASPSDPVRRSAGPPLQ